MMLKNHCRPADTGKLAGEAEQGGVRMGRVKQGMDRWGECGSQQHQWQGKNKSAPRKGRFGRVVAVKFQFRDRALFGPGPVMSLAHIQVDPSGPGRLTHA